MRSDPDATQIQAIGVPTDLNADVGPPMSVGMLATGDFQKPELSRFEREEATVDLPNQIRGARTVFGIATVVFTTQVVEECEQLHDPGVGSQQSSQHKSVVADPSPVRHPVNPAPVEPKLGFQEFQ